jgi:hypothetical protein
MLIRRMRPTWFAVLVLRHRGVMTFGLATMCCRIWRHAAVRGLAGVAQQQAQRGADKEKVRGRMRFCFHDEQCAHLSQALAASQAGLSQALHRFERSEVN